MFCDTDVLIAYYRGVAKAAKVLTEERDRRISIVTYMELMGGARNKEDARRAKAMMSDAGFVVVPLNENISHRAALYIEQHALGEGIGLADALIAATAVEHGQPLLTGNVRHFRAIKDLTLRPFTI